jgi:hypothetical protein
VRLLLLLAVAGLGLLFVWWFVSSPPERVARTLRRGLLWAGGGLLVFLAATGRLPWLFALLGAAVPFVQRLARLGSLFPILRHLQGLFRGSRPGGTGGGRASRVRTRYLYVELAHDTGELSGEVLAGRYAGTRLAAMGLDALLELHDELAREDPESVPVLEAFLDRAHGDWRDAAPGSAEGPARPAGGPMSREEAYEILGLAPGADREEILRAHRRLMQRLHPDRGGSGYLAAQINKAKDLLLGHR